MESSTENRMMALSDYSFLERSVHEVYIWIWFIIHVYRCDGFLSLRWKRIRKLELRSFITILILLTLPLEAFYDIILTKIKYTEGFYLFVPSFSIRSKPKWLWSQEDQLWWTPTFYTLMVGFSFQTGTLFLLQCFWNYLSKSIANIPFMSKFEFNVYIFWGIISVLMFPILPVALSGHESLVQVIPQLAYASQIMISVLLGIITHLRFQNLISQIDPNNKNRPHLIAKIRYFVDMNKLLTGSLFIMSASFFILTLDTLTDSKPINSSKLASDILIAHVNFAAVIEWVILILIFYPRKGFVGTGAGGSTFNTNLGSVVTNSAKLSNVPPGSGAGFPASPTSNYNFNNNNNINENNLDNKDSSYNYNNNPGHGNYYYKDQRQQLRQQQPQQYQMSQNQLNYNPTPLTPRKNNNNNNNVTNNKTSSPLKRNVSISKDGKMIYAETKPLGKVGGSEFVAVEKTDPRNIPSYYFTNDSVDNNSGKKSPSSSENVNENNQTVGGSNGYEEPVPRKSTQQERMLVLQRQQDEFNALRVPSNSSSSMVNQLGDGENNTNSINEVPKDDLDHHHQQEETNSNESQDDEYFYAM